MPLSAGCDGAQSLGSRPCISTRTQVCPKDYLPALLKWIDEDNLPTYLGGKSKATLLDDSGPWNDPALVAQIEAELKAVRCFLCLSAWGCPMMAKSCGKTRETMTVLNARLCRSYSGMVVLCAAA